MMSWATSNHRAAMQGSRLGKLVAAAQQHDHFGAMCYKCSSCACAKDQDMFLCILDAQLFQDQVHPGTAMDAAAPLAIMIHRDLTVIVAV